MDKRRPRFRARGSGASVSSSGLGGGGGHLRKRSGRDRGTFLRRRDDASPGAAAGEPPFRITGILRPNRADERSPTEDSSGAGHQDNGFSSPSRAISGDFGERNSSSSEGVSEDENGERHSDPTLSNRTGGGGSQQAHPPGILLKKQGTGSSVPENTGGGGILHVRLNEKTSSVRSPPRMSKAVKLIDHRTEDLLEGALALHLDSNPSSFLVVGIAGMQGVGKSTLLNHLAQMETTADLMGEEDGQSNPFKTSATPVTSVTQGVEAFVTSDRIILLDTGPLLSLSLADSLVEEAHRNAHDAGGTDLVLLKRSLQVLSFLLMTCNVVLFVQEGISVSALKLLLYASYFKPFASHLGVNVEENVPNLVCIHNKVSRSSWTQMPQVVSSLQKAYSTVFRDTGFSASWMSNTLNMSHYLSENADTVNDTRTHGNNPLNLILLPYELKRELQKKSGTRTIYPRYIDVLHNFSRQLRCLPRAKLSYFATEEAWLSHATRVWMTIQKDSIVFEEFCKEVADVDFQGSNL